MFVKEIWRYPVKSMAGESLTQASIGALGIEGDRVIQVRDKQGRVVTARTEPGLLGHRARFDAGGNLLVDDRPWPDAKVLADVRKIAGPGAELIRDESEERFDILPLLVATDGAIAAFGRDGRRLRPNLVIGGVDGLDERKWPGRNLRIGEVVIGLDSLRGRCVMTTFDPDTLEHDPEVLRDIVKRFGGRLALNSRVLHGGVVSVGDPVEMD